MEIKLTASEQAADNLWHEQHPGNRGFSPIYSTRVKEALANDPEQQKFPWNLSVNELQGVIDTGQNSLAGYSSPSPCPYCGYCHHCDRGGHYHSPWYQGYPLLPYPSPNTTWTFVGLPGTNTLSGSTS